MSKSLFQKVFLIVLTFTASFCLLSQVYAGPAGVVSKAPSSGPPNPDPATEKILLGPTSFPAKKTLYDWYCTLDSRPITIAEEASKILNLMPDFREQASTNEIYTTEEEKTAAAREAEKRWLTKTLNNYRSKPLENSFPASSLEKEPTLYGLDAPPGGTVKYTKQMCYLTAELQELKSLLIAEIQKRID